MKLCAILYSGLKDKVTPGRTMFFRSEIKRWQCVCWLSILWAFKSIRCKRSLFDNNRLKNQPCPRIAPNHLRPTGKRLETLCLVLSCGHFVLSSGLLYLWIFIRKKMWALKVEKDGHDPNTFSSLKEILRLVIICQGKFSVYWSVDRFHVQYITFQFIVNYDKFSVL